MPLIPLRNKKGYIIAHAIVDKRDFNRLVKYKWCQSASGYVVRNIRDKITKKFTTLYIHREILKPEDGLVCDHKNQNKLDNRRRNLRLATHSENLRNRPKNKTNKSGFKGVSWCKEKRKWRAKISYNGKQTSIGSFLSKSEASVAYNLKAIELFGEFAFLNK